MRDVLSASLAGTALLTLAASLVLAQTTTPATPPGDAAAAPTGGIADWWWVLRTCRKLRVGPKRRSNLH